MGTFIAAYTIVWLALVLYIVRLRIEQRDLLRLAKSIETKASEPELWNNSGTPEHPGV